MQMRPLGQSGIEASVVALGALAIGGWMWGGSDEAEAIRAIHAAIDAGINYIDTAPVYGFGRSEDIVGKAIANRRDKVIIASKCGLVWDRESKYHHFNASKTGKDENADDYRVYRLLEPASIREEIENSLKRLRVDCIDLYQTHWQEPHTPIADTMAELLKLKDEGKIRAIGCSNATPEQMDQYRAIGPLDADQEIYNMLYRRLEETNLPYCHENNVAFLAFSPIAQGLLTGKVTADREFDKEDHRASNPHFSIDNRLRVTKMLNKIKPIADAHDITLAQLAIAWTIAQPGCTHALVGARTDKQALENAAAGSVILTEEELAEISTHLI